MEVGMGRWVWVWVIGYRYRYGYREEGLYTPPPPGNHFRDCKCAGIETTTSIHHPLWVVVVVVVVYRFGLPNIVAFGIL